MKSVIFAIFVVVYSRDYCSWFLIQKSIGFLDFTPVSGILPRISDLLPMRGYVALKMEVYGNKARTLHRQKILSSVTLQ